MQKKPGREGGLGIKHHVSDVNVHQLDRGGEGPDRKNVFSGRHPEQ